MQLVWWMTHAFLFVTQSLCAIFEKWNRICCKPGFIFYVSCAQRISFTGVGEWWAETLATDGEKSSQITEYPWKIGILWLHAVTYVHLYCLKIDVYYYIYWEQFEVLLLFKISGVWGHTEGNEGKGSCWRRKVLLGRGHIFENYQSSFLLKHSQVVNTSENWSYWQKEW